MAFRFIDPRRRRTPIKKSEESQAALDRLQECLQETVEEPVRFLESFWKDQALVLTYAELRAIVADEDIPEAIIETWRNDYAKLIADKITPTWRAAMEAGVRSNPILNGIEFDTTTLATKWIVDHGAESITNMIEDQVRALRYVLGESINYKMGAAETAQYIRPIIGLTEQQTAANMKYYNSIKQQLVESHPRMQTDVIERKARDAATNYAARQHRTRAETIARTEIATAYHEGNDLAVKESILNGALPKMRKEWSTSLDAKVCSSCMALEGVVVEKDGEFSVKSGKRTVSTSLPPLHPRCACAIKYVESDEKNDIIEASKVIDGHSNPPKKDEPGAIIDHIGKDGKVDVRAYYDSSGMKRREIHTTDHGNPKQHPYGENGEHVHIYTWNIDGSPKKRIIREVHEIERKSS